MQKHVHDYSTKVMNIGIYIYDNAEVLDFSGPFEVFTTASRVCADDEPFNVFLIGETQNAVWARAGYQVLPHYDISNHPVIDLLIVAGGVPDQELQKPHVLGWIKNQSDQAQYTASVCTGVFLLGAADVVATHNVTTHWEDIPALQKQFPKLQVHQDVRWVEDGNIFTSAGISAGIDMSLYLVKMLHSPTLSEKTARQMEYETG
ncbi:DJ-1/PfpI family protein [uncultured Desulfobacter sp.]|uniref:DJ-1/PfpI family protein n=1 Tax=uncultured Desulfobacter sp. TaxID=240139 RepID=UPI0029F4D9F2|nr:DJ-1/PfpI family protein [uncultured Desulfobacter sp.]